MRIISGEYKNHTFNAPKNIPTRPTTNRAKEGLFNTLNSRITFQDITVLDLFAGIGSISFEFVSRGSNIVTAVEQNPVCIRFLNDIKNDYQFSLKIIKSDVYKYINRTTSSFDIIFADPPYNIGPKKINLLVETLLKKNILNPNGMIILEHHKKENINLMIKPTFTKSYGDNCFSFISKSS